MPACLLLAPPMSGTPACLTCPSFHPPIRPVHRRGSPPTRSAHPLMCRWHGSHTHMSCMAHLCLAHGHLTCLFAQVSSSSNGAPAHPLTPPAHSWMHPASSPPMDASNASPVMTDALGHVTSNVSCGCVLPRTPPDPQPFHTRPPLLTGCVREDMHTGATCPSSPPTRSLCSDEVSSKQPNLLT